MTVALRYQNTYQLFLKASKDPGTGVSGLMGYCSIQSNEGWTVSWDHAASMEGRKSRGAKIPKKSVHHLVAEIRSTPAWCWEILMHAALPNSQVAQGTATEVSAAAVLMCPSHNSQGHIQRPQCTSVGQRCTHSTAPRASAITAHAPHALAPSCPLLTFLYFATRCHFQFFTFALFHTLWMSF